MHLRILASSVAVAAMLTTTGGCAAEKDADAGGSVDAQMLGHVHGFGIDPADGTLYIASHHGVYRESQTNGLERVADRWQDTMAFTVVGPGHFLASGHPDLRENLPSQLGLIESTDAAQTWRSVSLKGRADFHALDISGDYLFGYDSASQALVVTEDRRRWNEIANTPLGDITVDPTNPRRVLATTPQGELLEYAVVPQTPADTSPDTLDGPPLLFLDWLEADTVVGLGADGTTYLSPDRGDSWQPLSAVPGDPQALEVTPDRWYAATSLGVYQSANEGRTWEIMTGP